MNNTIFAKLLQNDGTCPELTKSLNPKSIIYILNSCSTIKEQKRDILQKILAVNEKALYKFAKNYERNNGWQKQGVADSLVHIDFYNRSNSLVKLHNREGLSLLQKIAGVVIKIPSILEGLSIDKKRSLFVLADDADSLEKLLTDAKTPINYDALFLHAVKTNAEKVSRLILEKYNPDINVQDKEGSTPLLHASINGSTIAFDLIKKNADINLSNHKGLYPLYCACVNGHKDILDALFEKDAKIKTIPDFPPFLYEVCCKGYFDRAEILVKDCTVHIDKTNNLQKTAFDYAYETTHVESLLYLASAGARRKSSLVDSFLRSGILKDINQQAPITGDTLIHIAVKENDLEAIKILVLEYGANINVQNSGKSTPLHIACENASDTNIIDFLLEHGADMYQIKDLDTLPVDPNDWCSPWILAIHKQDLKLISLFIKHGVDVNHHSELEPSAVLLAAGCELSILQLLVENGGDINYAKDGTTALMEAISCTNLENTKYLISKGADVHCVNRNGDTALLMICCKEDFGQLEIAQLLVQKGAELNTQNIDGETPLIQALLKENVELALYLIDQGADVNLASPDGLDPLYAALQFGRKEIIDALLDKDVFIRQYSEGASIVYLAALSLEYELAESFLEQGFDVNYYEGHLYGYPLIDCCAWDNFDVAVFLIDNGADVNTEINGEYPLKSAIKVNNIKLCQLLIERGAKVHFEKPNGRMQPIEVAIKNSNLNIIPVLIAHGADADFPIDGSFPIHYAIWFNRLDIVQTLVESKTNLNALGPNESTPLLLAIENDKTDIALYLIENDADINIPDKDGMNPLYLAISKKNKKLIDALLDKNPKVEQVPNKQLLLYHACENGYYDVAQSLLDKGLDIDFHWKGKYTALMEACSKKNADIACYLIEKGANLNTVLGDITALKVAMKNKNTLIVNKILQHPSHVFVGDECIHAAQQSNINILSVLVAHGANINCQDDDGKSPLSIAINNNNVDLVLYLIKNGAIMTAQNGSQINSLYYALINKKREVAQALVDNNFSISQVPDETLLLYIACENGYFDIAQSLLKKGLNIDFHWDGKYTALMEACSRNNSKVALFLIEKGANFNTVINNMTALKLAISRKNEKLVNAIMQQDVLKLIGDELCFACKDSSLSIVKVLFDCGEFDINQTHWHGQISAINIATGAKNLEIIQFLLENGADLKTKDLKGLTPLHVACSLGFFEAVELFVQHGADFFARDNKGSTPFHYACRHKSLKIITYAVQSFGKKVCDTEDDDGYLPLHVAAKFGSFPAIDYLVTQEANYLSSMTDLPTPLHIAIQFGQTEVSCHLLGLRPEELNFSLFLLAVQNDRDLASHLIDEGLSRVDRISFMKDMFKESDRALVLSFLSCLINLSHCESQIDLIDVPTTRPEGVALEKVFEYFKELIPESADSEKMAVSLSTLVNNILNRVAFTATPKDGDVEKLERYYAPIENALLKTISVIEEETDQKVKTKNKKRIVTELCIAGDFCGDRYITSSDDLFNEIVNNVTTTIQNKVLVVLRNARRMYLRQCVQTLDTHEYSTLLRLIGNKFGIPGHSMITFKEPQAKKIPEQIAKQRFYTYFTFENILESIEQELLQDRAQELFKEWAKDNLEIVSIATFELKMKILDRLEQVLYERKDAKTIFETLNDEFENDGVYIYCKNDPNNTYPTQEKIREKVLQTIEPLLLGSLFEPIEIDDGIQVRTSSRVKREVVLRALVNFGVFSKHLLSILPEVLEFLQEKKAMPQVN